MAVLNKKELPVRSLGRLLYFPARGVNYSLLGWRTEREILNLNVAEDYDA